MLSATRTRQALAAVAALVAALLVAGIAPATAEAEPEVRLLVTWRPVTPLPDAATVAERVGGRPVERVEAIGLDVVAVPAAAAGGTIARLRARPDVASAEVDQPVEATAQPTDPLWPQQWGPVRTRSTTAWDTTTGSPSVVIAILDTGVDAAHPELAGKLVPGTDVVNGDADPADDNGHGTAAAGVAAAHANNNIGAAGHCWGCRIMPVKVLGATGEGSTSTVASGITWAADQGARIINLSLSGTAGSAAFDRAIAYARSKGAVVIAAAGNEGTTVPNYPAASPGAISVAASDAADARYNFSSYGSWAKIAAPGCHLTPNRGGGYVSFCGTSSSTPAVAGIAGLLLSARPETTGSALESALTATAQPVGTWVASGRVDAAAALAALVGPTPPPASPAPPAPTVERVSGANRIETAVALSRRSRSTAPAAVIARADDYADALAAAPFAATVGGPLLLSARDALADGVGNEVRRLGAGVVYLAGGRSALSPSVEDALRAAGVTRIERIAGSNRFDTARLLALRVGGRSAYLTEGANPDPSRGWPDAVAVAGLAALERRPILLTWRDRLPDETRLALQQLGTVATTVVGGPVAISEDTARAAADPDGDGAGLLAVDRVAGADRWHTSTLVADRAVAAGATDRLWVATGNDWPDALASGPASAASGAVLVLVDGRDLSRSPAAEAWLAARQSRFGEVVIIGGVSSLSSVVESRVGELLR